jgi:hypothetical protein
MGDLAMMVMGTRFVEQFNNDVLKAEGLAPGLYELSSQGIALDDDSAEVFHYARFRHQASGDDVNVRIESAPVFWDAARDSDLIECLVDRIGLDSDEVTRRLKLVGFLREDCEP